MQHLKIRHVLDVMHCEKNLYENILRTLLGETDYCRGREDMQEMDIREELWLRPSLNNPGHYMKPHPTYVLTPSEWQQVMDVISNLRFPTDYAGNMQSHVCEGRLRFMKSHDFHIMLQQISSSE